MNVGKFVNLNMHSDKRGKLVSIEENESFLLKLSGYTIFLIQMMSKLAVFTLTLISSNWSYVLKVAVI